MDTMFPDRSFRISEKKEVSYLEALPLTACGYVRHAFCMRTGGVSEGAFASFNFGLNEGDDERKVKANWKILAAAFNIPAENFFPVHQIHRDGIHVIENSADAAGSGRLQADGIITTVPGIALCIKTADCVPVFLFDPVRRVVGAFHAGWRGTAMEIVARGVAVFVRKFAANPSELIACIGPSIGGCCYEVDILVLESMKGAAESGSLFRKSDREGRWMLDLAEANRVQLLAAGISEANIFSAGVCTCCHEEHFFSYRREGRKSGRQINFIMLER